MCGGGDSETPGNDIVSCNACRSGFHQQCCNLPSIPVGEWLCATCTRLVNTRKRQRQETNNDDDEPILQDQGRRKKKTVATASKQQDRLYRPAVVATSKYMAASVAKSQGSATSPNAFEQQWQASDNEDDDEEPVTIRRGKPNTRTASKVLEQQDRVCNPDIAKQCNRPSDDSDDDDDDDDEEPITLHRGRPNTRTASKLSEEQDRVYNSGIATSKLVASAANYTTRTMPLSSFENGDQPSDEDDQPVPLHRGRPMTRTFSKVSEQQDQIYNPGNSNSKPVANAANYQTPAMSSRSFEHLDRPYIPGFTAINSPYTARSPISDISAPPSATRSSSVMEVNNERSSRRSSVSDHLLRAASPVPRRPSRLMNPPSLNSLRITTNVKVVSTPNGLGRGTNKIPAHQSRKKVASVPGVPNHIVTSMCGRPPVISTSRPTQHDTPQPFASNEQMINALGVAHNMAQSIDKTPHSPIIIRAQSANVPDGSKNVRPALNDTPQSSANNAEIVNVPRTSDDIAQPSDIRLQAFPSNVGEQRCNVPDRLNGNRPDINTPQSSMSTTSTTSIEQFATVPRGEDDSRLLMTDEQVSNTMCLIRLNNEGVFRLLAFSVIGSVRDLYATAAQRWKGKIDSNSRFRVLTHLPSGGLLEITRGSSSDFAELVRIIKTTWDIDEGARLVYVKFVLLPDGEELRM